MGFLSSTFRVASSYGLREAAEMERGDLGAELSRESSRHYRSGLEKEEKPAHALHVTVEPCLVHLAPLLLTRICCHLRAAAVATGDRLLLDISPSTDSLLAAYQTLIITLNLLPLNRARIPCWASLYYYFLLKSCFKPPEYSSKMSSSVPADMINLRLILVSGKTKEFLFSPNDSAADIAKHVYDNWPMDWEEEQVSSPNILRLIYQGRFLHGNVTLGALKLPFGKTTVMHLVARETLPEPNSQGQRNREKTGESNCCVIL
nr:ubiquitin-like protein 3 [Chelonoidis abingdonii]